MTVNGYYSPPIWFLNLGRILELLDMESKMSDQAEHGLLVMDCGFQMLDKKE